MGRASEMGRETVKVGEIKSEQPDELECNSD